ncbi:MAG: hypothetical protein HQL41_01930 [Alphaproteobacteria bacterium]|nr:hypothetical protein [Alphaproteobacteria bacterium]
MADDRGVTAKLDQLAELMMREFSAMKAEIGEARTDVGTLRTEVGTLRTEIGALRADVGALRTDFKTLDDRMRGIEIAVAETRGRIAERSAMLQLVMASEISAA